MWDNLSVDQKREYKKMILAFTSLSEMFAQKEDSEESNNINISPIINSKYQETVFQRVFNASAEDIGNTSYDAALQLEQPDGSTIKYLIGIKTFGIASNAQKVAQFKTNQNEWMEILNEIRENSKDDSGNVKDKKTIDQVNESLYLKLAKRIAVLRNLRIESSASNIQGFSVLEGSDNVESVYHVLMPSRRGETPSVSVGEISYDKIDVEHIRVLGCTSAKNPTNFNFSDGNHTYRFTSADSQLLMDFKNNTIVKDIWPVVYANDAYKIFSEIAERVQDQQLSQIVESHSWKLNVQLYSGFNSFYGVGSKMGIDSRKGKIDRLLNKYQTICNDEILERLEVDLTNFLCSDEDSNQKCLRRKELLIFLSTLNNNELLEDVKKIVFRPKEEIYIPILNSRSFHKEHPDFFGDGIGDLSFTKGDKDKAKFTMVLEPSGEEFECFITQEGGKAIESVGRQSILGEWILRKVFQLNEYEPLTEKRLAEVGINGIRFFKTKDKKVHMQFIWIDGDDLPSDYMG